MDQIKELIAANPVRARAAVVALVSALAGVVPALAGLDVEGVAGVVVGLVALLCGADAAKRVTLNETSDMDVMAAARDCCACPHQMPEGLGDPGPEEVTAELSRKDLARRG
ncbi:hypothetical protein [Streptomyces sp. SID14515]|uniref:hypothetical protein n=1 Tax=Streptomyces sp. SID14515 TaxID=2706074 RepID=UPI0013CD045A|nr:hypothetical protein [Streptomyces sp. SID14515]NEB35883.1 hypothetical protein [Streptomyces sp. SID14515]